MWQQGVFSCNSFRKFVECTRNEMPYTARKLTFSINGFFSKCDQIRRFLQIWSHLPKKCLMEKIA